MKKYSAILIMSGVLLMLYPLFTSLYSHYEQRQLRARAESTKAEAPEQGREQVPEQNENPSLDKIAVPEQVPGGDFAGAYIEIPVIDLSTVMLRGTEMSTLNKAPGWYEESALPGHGNTAIAGHRTMHGGWFRNLDLLKEGDSIIIGYNRGVYIYRVERVFVVASNDWSVIDPTPYPSLTLTTCHPIGNATRRLVVRAALVSGHYQGAFLTGNPGGLNA